MSPGVGRRVAGGTLAALCAAVACAVNPVTGKRQLSLLSESQEIAMGKEADPQIVAAYGLYEDPTLAAYVDSIGQRLAAMSHRPNLQYTFRVLDSPVINAFALPGGYIYITRGIVAHMNNEAELAMVLGHEIGHVTARHGAEQYSRATLAGVGLGIGGILVPEVAQFGQLAETALGLLFLKYGRDQENQSDELGVLYSSRAGFDPAVGARFFEVLDRQQQESGQALPGWLSTHPAPADRVVRTQRLAAQAKTGRGDYRVGEAAHKKRLDGVVFGDDPRHGFLDGNTFKHPDLEFELVFPVGWKVQNLPQAVVATEPNGRAQLRLTLAPAEGASPGDYVLRLAAASNATLVEGRNERIGGYTAYVAVLSVAGEQGADLVQVAAIQRNPSGPIYRILGLADRLAVWQPRLLESMRSFGPLRDSKALALQPNRVRLLSVAKRETLQQAVGGLRDVPVPIGALALLNNLAADSALEAGFRLKVVRGTYRGGE